MATRNSTSTRERADFLHSDALVWLLHDHMYTRVEDTLAMRAGGVAAKVLVPVADLAIYNDSAVGEDHAAFYARTLAQVDGWARESIVRLIRARRLLESRPDAIVVAESVADVLRARETGKVAVLLGMEGCKAFEGRIELVDGFHRLGVRQMQLAWAMPNHLVDVDPTSRAWMLSDFGRAAVRRMNELGVVIDLAHAPLPFVREVAALSRTPVIVSHGAPREPFGSGDMTREHLDLLSATGGLLGLHFCRHYVNGPFATFADFLVTIDWLVENGYGGITALGGDLFDDDDYFRARHPAPSGATHATWRPFIDEIADVRRLDVITEGLVARGHDDETIRNILGLNALRVYRAALGG